MPTETGTVWAIDIGNDSLKALNLSTERGVVEVIGFDNIRHGKILSGDGVTDAEKEELIALSLRKFVNKHDLSLDEIAISVPSQNSFARFVNLPPVERKRIPEMVRFEAVQQIPFGINDVQWDYQEMTESDSAEIKVGIFAIKNEVVNSTMEHFEREDVQVGYVQMVPMALYNYILHDRPDLFTSDSQAIVALNIGADNTDLVVCTKSSVWQRCILIGGNAFTKAIAETFKLNFEKAEKLKRTAPVSKYARQIFQAMRPVFTDLASEVQRSLNFYNSSEPNIKIVRVIALGGGTKLRGLLKYLQQTLQIPVERPDSFKRLVIGTGVSPAKFHGNVCDFGIVYGLALQGLGLSRIESNLLPRAVARSMAWSVKSRYFLAAACMMLVVGLLGFARLGWDRMNYFKNSQVQVRQRTASILNTLKQPQEQLEEEQRKGAASEAIISKEFEPFQYREVIPLIHEIVFSALPNEKNNPAQAQLYQAFAKSDVEKVMKVPRKERKQIFITSMSGYFSSDLATAQFGGADQWRSSRNMTGLESDPYAFGSLESFYMDPSLMGQGAYSMEGYGLMGAPQEEKKAGFVVTIAGYSPYKNLGELIDPPGVQDRQDKWGIVTRLMHLDDFVDGNSPFELFEKTKPEHFKLQIGEVIWGDNLMPPGVGIPEVGYKTAAASYARQGSGTEEQILIDPLTKETISKVAELNEYGKQKLYQGMPVSQVNDHWFVLNFKLNWRDVPETAKAKKIPLPPHMAGLMGMYPSPQSSGAVGE